MEYKLASFPLRYVVDYKRERPGLTRFTIFDSENNERGVQAYLWTTVLKDNHIDLYGFTEPDEESKVTRLVVRINFDDSWMMQEGALESERELKTYKASGSFGPRHHVA